MSLMWTDTSESVRMAEWAYTHAPDWRGPNPYVLAEEWRPTFVGLPEARDLCFVLWLKGKVLRSTWCKLARVVGLL